MNPIEEFHAGVTACLRSWSALRSAVDSGWGGGLRESQGKADNLRLNLFQLMDGSQCPPANFDEQDLADNLAIYMEEEFSVTLEDGSERQVAQAIFRIYEGCCNGDPTLARQMVAHADSAVTFNSQFPMSVQTTEHDDEDDDEDMGAQQGNPAETTQLNTAPAPNQLIPADYSTQPLFGAPAKVHVPTGPVRQLGDAAAEKPTAEMDDDGFASVAPKSRRRK